MMIRETILICLVISEGLWAREVIVVSGTDNYDNSVLEVFDFGSRSWTAVEKVDTEELESLDQSFSYRTSVQRLPGRARLVDEDNDVVEYTLDNGIAKKLADYPEEASGATVLEYGDTVCLVGGYDTESRSVRRSVHCWNPLAMAVPSSSARASGWVALPEMNTGRFRPGAVVMDGKMYVAGGRDPDISHSDLDTMEVFDDVTQRWYLTRARLSEGRTAFQLLAVSGKLYALGGWSNHKFSNTVEEYDPIPDEWRRASEMNPRAKFGSVVTSDGSVYVVGGLKGLDLGQQTNRVEVYNPKNNSWSDPLPPLSVISGPVRATLVVEDESIPPILTGR